jgi:NADH-quinone oxidoreductase subunit E
VLSDKARRDIQDLKKKFETNQSALIPALHRAQADQGWLSEETQAEVAQLLELSLQTVAGVVSFYTMFHRKPVGKYLLQVCRNLSCTMLGGQSLRRKLEERLGIAEGETTPDGRYTLIEVECLGSCGTAPVVMVNDRYFEGVKPDDVEKLLAELQ